MKETPFSLTPLHPYTPTPLCFLRVNKDSASVWHLAIAKRCCEAQNAPDGSFLASVGEDNTLVIWNLARILKLDLLEYGCNWVRDYLRTNVGVEESDTL